MARRKPALLHRTPPTRDVMQPDGTVRVEKLSPIPYHRKMVDPDGNIVAVSLAPGRDFIPGVDQDNQYGVVTKLRKAPPKWLPFDECPRRKGYLPPSSDAPEDRGCDGDDGQGRFGLGKPGPNGFRNGDGVQCCPHLRAVIAARRAKKKIKNDGVNTKFAQNQDRVLKELMRATEALTARATDVRSDNASVGFGGRAAKGVRDHG